MFEYLKTFYQAMKLGVYYSRVADKSSRDQLHQEMLEALNIRS